MRNRFARAHAAMRLATSLIEDNGDVVGEVLLTGTFNELRDATGEMGRFASSQSAHRQGLRGSIKQVRKMAADFRASHVIPIVRLARLQGPEIANLEGVRLPNLRANPTQLAADAIGLADAVAPFARELHLAGLRPEFVPELRAAAAELTSAVDAAGRQETLRIKATAQLDAVVEHARRAMSACDSLVKRGARENTGFMAEWDSVYGDFRRALNTRAVRRPEDAAQLPTPQLPPASPSGPQLVLPLAA
jgi:hypothetical protein